MISIPAISHHEESQSTPALIHVPEAIELTSSLGMIPENTLLESYTRLSVSLEENGLFQVSITVKIRERKTSKNLNFLDFEWNFDRVSVSICRDFLSVLPVIRKTLFLHRLQAVHRATGVIIHDTQQWRSTS